MPTTEESSFSAKSFEDMNISKPLIKVNFFSKNRKLLFVNSPISSSQAWLMIQT